MSLPQVSCTKNNVLKVSSVVSFIFVTELCFNMFVYQLMSNEYNAIRRECLYKENFPEYFFQSLSSDTSKRLVSEFFYGVDTPARPRQKRSSVWQSPVNNGRGSTGLSHPIGPPGVKGSKGEPGDNSLDGPPGIKGDKGMKGAIGPQGIEGRKGDPGMPGINEAPGGPPGLPGPPGQIGEKGEPGDNALDQFPGPKGDKGSKGEPGDNPLDGSPGIKGDKGIKGEPGDNALDGSPGIKGDKGLDGKSGKQGPPGLSGEKGSRGDNGIEGIPGRKGEPGLHGKDGLPGLQGFKGDSGRPGIPGIDGRPGLSGEKGSRGDNGIEGIPGRKGEPGLHGKDGLPGLQGFKGDSGQPGIPGTKGERGLNGINGEQGPPGPQGEGFSGCKMHFAHSGNSYQKFYIMISRDSIQKDFYINLIAVGPSNAVILLTESNDTTTSIPAYEIDLGTLKSTVSICKAWPGGYTKVLGRDDTSLTQAESPIRSYSLHIYEGDRIEIKLGERVIINWTGTYNYNLKYLSFGTQPASDLLYIYNCEENTLT